MSPEHKQRVLDAAEAVAAALNHHTSIQTSVHKLEQALDAARRNQVYASKAYQSAKDAMDEAVIWTEPVSNVIPMEPQV